MFGKIAKQINGLIAPQTIARVRDQGALQHVFASYHTLLLQQRATADRAADPTAPPQAKRAHSTAAADTAAFRRAVDAALATPTAVAAAAAATAAGAHPSPATLSSASPSPSPLVPAVRAEQKMSLSLAPRDETSRAVVARCGFTPLLVLTFKMARRTLGSIVQHLALKWFSGVRLRPLAAVRAHATPPPAPQEAGPHEAQRPRKPAAVRYGMRRITLVLQHGGSGAVVGSWDRRNGALFSDFVPTLPTSISAPVLASPDAALPVLYAITGIAPDDVLPLSSIDDAPQEELQRQQHQQERQQQSATWREQSDSIPQFHSFGRPSPPPPPQQEQEEQEQQEGEEQHREEEQEEGEESQRGQGRRDSDGRTGLEGGGELSRLGDDAGAVVHIDKSFTSFVLESADAPGASLLRAGLTSSQFPSPLRACAALAPSAQATPQTPMRALFSTSAACSPATLATPTFAAAARATAAASTGSSPTGATGTPAAGTGASPDRVPLAPPFFTSVVCALPGDAGASRDGLPKEDSQLALFPERSLGYSNPGLPFLAGPGAGGPLGLGGAMGSAAATTAASAGNAAGPSFPLFSGGTLNGADNSNF